MRISHCLALAAAVLLVPAVAAAQARPEVITGRITSDSGAGVAGALVSATMAPDRLSRQATTDSTGRYRLRFENGTGDYLMHVAHTGHRAVRKRLTRTGTDSILRFDVALVLDVAKLAAVTVKAKAPRPLRGDRDGNDAGAVEREREGVFASLSFDQEGNLGALGNAIPGATAQPEGLSVLGLDGSQSNVTLNGLAFAGTTLPRDARMSTRVTTSAYDPARGGFSGGQTSVELSRGSRVAQRRSHLTLDAPALQAPDGIANRLGQRFTSYNGSIGGSGEAVRDTWYYNSALQLSRRSAPAPSLVDSGDDILALAGVAPDSARRLVQLLGGAGIPVSAGATPAIVTDAASFVARLDYKPFVGSSNEPSPSTWNATLFANHKDDRALALAPTVLPTRAGSRASYAAGSQLAWSKYFGNTLNDLRTSLSVTRDHGTAATQLPGGSVLVSSVFDDGSTALTGLTFGGNGALESDRRSWSWETINETQWYRRGSPHRIKLTTEARLDGYRNSPSDNLLGTFNYSSLAAFASNQPTSFTRTLRAPAREGGLASAYVALGDYWRVSQTFLLIYGARLEGSRFTSAPNANGAIASAFGVSNAHAPSGLHVSPRVGFTWFAGGGEKGTSIRINQYAIQPLPPKGVLKGGIGEFRGMHAPSLLADASALTGLANGVTRIACLGASVPAPRFDAYANDASAIPTACVSAPSSTFSDAAPSVLLFDRAYDAARSWRANLSWASTFKRVGLSVEGVYSLNLDQPGTVDLNFSGAPKFSLAEEDGRPVFVNAASIVAGSGSVSPRDARMNPAFGRVTSMRSDLASRSRQITATITPAQFSRIYYSAAYTLGDVRGDVRGFEGTTFGAPTNIEHGAASLDVRHQLQMQVGTALPFGMTLGLFGRFMSGLPYTPRIAGDVNGDGLSNDRAFIFDPSRTADASLAAGMRDLLVRAPASARECLRRQIGHASGRNSCRSPWTAFMNARVGLVNRTGFTRRAFSATLNVSNPLGGLDQLLHGASNLSGWGTSVAPDPTLLVVRGFDPIAQRFRYEVNPQFGRAPRSLASSRVPFRVTVDFTFDLGVPVQKQQALRLLSPGRANTQSRLSADTMAVRLQRQVPDIYKAILAESDSLLITRGQSEALVAAQKPYRARLDSLWATTGRALAAMESSYDADAAMRIIDEATERAWLVGRDQLPVLRGILSPLQLQLAPWIPAIARTEGRKVVGLRVFGF